MTTKYTPVPCSIYGKYESAIFKGHRLRLCWVGAQGQHHIETVTISDLRVKHRAEYMICQNRHGRRRILRLDRVRSARII